MVRQFIPSRPEAIRRQTGPGTFHEFQKPASAIPFQIIHRKDAGYGIPHGRKEKTGIRAAIIREKGVNGDREMAYALHLAGMDVRIST